MITENKDQNQSQNGIEKTFTQIMWLNINFDKLNVELDAHKLPTNKFYNKFYQEIFKKYQNFESLPKNWLIDKEGAAKIISQEVYDNQVILSYGCGIGYVEKVLTKINPTLEVFAFDFSIDASKWIKNKFAKIVHIEKLEANQKFDLIYLSHILYALSYSDSVDLIKTLSNQLKPDGKILLINTSITPSENGSIESTKTLKNYLINIIYPIHKIIFPTPKNYKEQFFGWQRDNKRFFEISIQANMNVEKSYFAYNQSFILLSKSY